MKKRNGAMLYGGGGGYGYKKKSFTGKPKFQQQHGRKNKDKQYAR